MTRVLIYGGRDWDNQILMNERLDALHAEHRFTLVINGGQKSWSREERRYYGADWQALCWAKSRGIQVDLYQAHWDLHGKSAGPRRNAQMMRDGQPEIGIEFPGRKGTANMRGLLDRAGVPVIEVPGP